MSELALTTTFVWVQSLCPSSLHQTKPRSEEHMAQTQSTIWKGGLGHPGEKTDLSTFLLNGEVHDCDIKDAEIQESGEKRNILD